jgi:NitT/TauT family transport system ATP-binding protein
MAFSFSQSPALRSARSRRSEPRLSLFRLALFREHLLRFVPITAHICRVLHERKARRAPKMRFEAELEDHLTRREAERTQRAVTAWGRYAKLLAYDDGSHTFSAITKAE